MMLVIIVLLLSLCELSRVIGMSNQTEPSARPQDVRHWKIHSYMEKLYNRVQKNSNGSFTIFLQNRAVVVDSIEGFEPSIPRVVANRARNVHLTFKIRNTSQYTSNLAAAELVITTKTWNLTAASRVMAHVFGGRGFSTQLLGSYTVPQVSNAAFPLDVKQALEAQSSPANKDGMLKLQISVSGFDRNGTAIASFNIWSCFHHGHKNGPYLVLYTSTAGDSDESVLQRLFKVSPSILTQNTFTRYQTRKKNRTKRNPSKLCHLGSLSVNMQRVLPTIVVPTVAQVNYCIGHCTIPISNHLTPTNHAIIMAILYGSQSTTSPFKKPHCVPTNLTGASVMYFDDDENKVVLKQWKDMIANQCGCR